MQSVIEQCSAPVSIIPLHGRQRDGTNSFTYERFLIPHHCGYKGFAIFVDGSDMLLRSDIAELWALRSGWHAAQVVKHEYTTTHPRKYLGTPMEADNRDYPRKNWSSVVLWNCEHYMNRCLTPESLEKLDGSYLHRFSWLPDDRIGELPAGWNWLVDEYGENERAKILHWTAGMPGFKHYAQAPHAKEWRDAAVNASYAMN